MALGHHVRTQQFVSEKMREDKRKGLSPATPTSPDTGRPVFPISFRELDTVVGVSPPVHHHSLLAPDPTPPSVRYREFIVFLLIEKYALEFVRHLTIPTSKNNEGIRK